MVAQVETFSDAIRDQRGTSITLHLKPADPDGIEDYTDKWILARRLAGRRLGYQLVAELMDSNLEQRCKALAAPLVTILQREKKPKSIRLEWRFTVFNVEEFCRNER